jgi:selenocysteine-specific elongation factor
LTTAATNTVLVAEPLPPCRVVATAGHVDHGKSTLVRALTGTDPDRWAEEKARGLTIDLGFAHTLLDSGTELSFVDVPGHVRFLPNMLAGVGGVAACLFVVAATEGWKPQSEEHLCILELAGTPAGVVALTKVDGLDADEVELARLELAEHLEGSFLAAAPVVEVSAPTGRGIAELRQALDSVLNGLDEAVDVDRPRLWVDRSFSASGAGTVVTGTLTGGALEMGDQVVMVPGSATATATGRIRGLQAHGRAVDRVGPGRRVAVNLAGLEVGAVGRGQAMVRTGQWEPTARFDVGLEVLRGLAHPVVRRGAYVVHCGTYAGRAEVQLLGGRAEASPGASVTARIRLPAALAILPGDRFVLRESGRDETVGGGEVLDVHPVLRPGRAAPDRLIDRVVAERGWIDVALLERITGERRTPDLGHWVVDPEARRVADEEVRSRVTLAGSEGISLGGLDDRLRAVATNLADLQIAGDKVRLAGMRTQLDPCTSAWLAEIERELFSPGPPEGIDRGILRELVQQGSVIETEGLYFHSSAIERAADLVAEALSVDPEGVTASQIRQALGTSRKWALPLLGYLDANGFTRRRGDLRIPGPRLARSDRGE